MSDDERDPPWGSNVRRWLPAEDRYLLALFAARQPAKFVAMSLGRSRKAVEIRRWILGGAWGRGGSFYFSAAEIERLKLLAGQGRTGSEIAREMKRSAKTIRRYAKQLRVTLQGSRMRRSDEIATPLSRCTKLTPRQLQEFNSKISAILVRARKAAAREGLPLVAYLYERIEMAVAHIREEQPHRRRNGSGRGAFSINDGSEIGREVEGIER